MNKILKVVVMVIPLLGLIACGDGLHSPSNESVKGGKIVVDFPSALIKPGLVAKGLIPESQTVYGYKAYEIPYITTDEEDKEVKVSGLLVIPTGLPEVVTSTLGLSMVSDDHGTIFADREAPTTLADASGKPEGSSIILTSIGGFATLQPDYVGFGDSKGHYHPFILKKSLANATVDFIKQVKIFAADNDIKLNNQLFLTGYSEGGYAAMATLKKIEDENLTDLAVTMAAPMSGPYAFKGLADVVLSQDTLTVPSFMANVGYAYAKAYGQDVETIINEPYASKLPTLFNGDLNRSQIDPSLTLETKGATGLFVGNFVTNYFTDENHWFRKAAEENSIHAWAPKTPIRLVHCKGDTVIPYAISQATYGAMKATNPSANVALVPVEETLGLGYEVNHGSCGSLAYGVAATMFATVRKQTIGY